MSLLVGSDGGGSAYWTENISSLNVITRQARMNSTGQSEDSPSQPDELNTNGRAVQGSEHL